MLGSAPKQQLGDRLDPTPSGDKVTEQGVPEIVECYRMAGETDHLRMAVVPDMAGCEAIYKKLFAIIELTDVSATFLLSALNTPLNSHFLIADIHM